MKYCFFVCLAIVALFDFVAQRHFPHFRGDTIPLFWSAFGLCACLVMGAACKWLSKKILARDEEQHDK